MIPNRPPARPLCLDCALCCNGVLFKDVEVQPSDNAAQLEAGGLVLQRRKARTRFQQPCAALCADQRCRIYSQRPVRCREFECHLLKETAAGRISVDAALRVIGQALRRADRVRRLLRALGDPDEGLPLSARFRRTRRRMETSELDDATAETFADLTLAVLSLNLLLSQSFHPRQPVRRSFPRVARK